MVQKHLPLIAGLALIGSQVSDIKNIIPESLHSSFLLVITLFMLYFSWVNLKGYWRICTSLLVSTLGVYISFGLFDYHPIDSYRCNEMIEESEVYYLNGDYVSSFHMLSGPISESTCSSSEENRLERLVQLSKVNWKIGDQETAENQVEQVIGNLTINNKQLLAKAYRVQGNIYNEQQKWVDAERSFNNAIKFGGKDFRLIVDLAITKRRLDLNPKDDLINVVRQLKAPKNVAEREVLISAYRQLSSLSDNCKSEAEYLHNAYTIASAESKLILLKTINYDDYIFAVHRCESISDNPDVNFAYSNGQKWLSVLSSTQDRNKTLFNRSDKYAMLLRDLAFYYDDKINSGELTVDETSEYIALRDESIQNAERIVNTGKQYVDLIKGHYGFKLRWQLTRATIANALMDNVTLKESLKEAQLIAKIVPKTNEKNWGALAEYYQLSGQLLRDPLTVLKAYSIYYATSVGHDSDLALSQKYLENSGITGLPSTKTSSILVTDN